jgi:hypothetical protein
MYIYTREIITLKYRKRERERGRREIGREGERKREEAVNNT